MVKRKTLRHAVSGNNGFVDYRILQQAAAIMLPFYLAIAGSQKFAERWSEAVVATDLEEMQRLLVLVSPRTKGLPLGTNGIGYFVAFPPDGDSPVQLTNGTTIPPGSVQFFFETRVHRAIAHAVLPLYKELARNRSFAIAFSRAVAMGDDACVRRMVRSLVRTPALISIGTGVEEGGLSLTFKYKFSPYRYRNLLFLDTV